jgi:L-lactate dehydrogenase
MSLKKSKIAIIGTGLVGSSTAFSLITQGVCDEILMSDIDEERALGEVMDFKSLYWILK